MAHPTLSHKDSLFLSRLRAASILVIIFGHTGGFWLLGSFGEALTLAIPLFFFLSGAIAFYSHGMVLSQKIFIQKRIISLLVPYYLICFIALLIFIFENQAIPKFSVQKVVLWLTLSPSDDISPFNLGQVWFLRCLVLISLLSPLIFKVRLIKNIHLIFIIPVILSSVQLLYNVGVAFRAIDNRTYITIIYFFFYSGGLIFFSKKTRPSPKCLFVTGICCLTVMPILIAFGVQENLGPHSFYPDLYYLMAGTAFITILFSLQTQLLKVSNPPFIDFTLQFCFKHTFALYLLHSLAIFLAEKILLAVKIGLDHGILAFGLTKLTIVLGLSSLMAIPFTTATKMTTKWLLQHLVPQPIKESN